MNLSKGFRIIDKRTDKEIDGRLFVDNQGYTYRKVHKGKAGFELEYLNKHDYAIEPVSVKVIKGATSVGNYSCPNCKAAFIESLGTTNFCGNCGVKLDWGEDE